MKLTTLLWCATAVAACAQAARPSDQATLRLQEARSLLRDDPERSLRITDELLAQTPGWQEARLCAAEGSMRLARTGSSARRDLLLEDAVRNFERATDGGEPAANPGAWLMLAECHYELGAFATAADVANRAARAFAEATPPDQRRAAEALLLAGRGHYRQFVTLRDEERKTGEADRRGVVPPAKETARLATAAVAAFEAVRGVLPGEACTQIALVHQWLDQSQSVIAEYERGIRSAPNETAIHDAYLEWMRQSGQQQAAVGAYTAFVREQPTVPLLRWYQGYALYLRADQLRADGNFQGAIDAYTKAAATYADYGAQQPQHKDATSQWLALCELSIARTSVEIGDLQGARRHLFAAHEASPLTASYDGGKPQIVDSFGQHYAGVAFVIHRATAETAADPLRETLAFNEAVLARHPDRWGWVYNNAALAARDLGVQVAKNGDDAGAMQLWEKSYALYAKAAELSPDDARIVNDCGLMLIYHLHREFDRARALFEQAIAVGERQLAELPADAERRDRELLEEAVGDAWQNLAVLAREHLGKAFDEYRPFCEKAVQYYPYQRREAAAMLRNAGDGALQSTQRSAATDATADADSTAQGGAAEAFAKAKKAAQTKAEGGDLDGALAELDGIAKQCAAHAPFHAYRGELTLQLAKSARDSGRKGVEFLFADAIAALKKAVELDGEPVDPRRMLAEAQYENGELEDAAQTCSQLLLHMQSQGGATPEALAAVHVVRANAAARQFAAKKNEGADAPEMLTAARASFRLLEQQGRLDGTLRSLWSVTEQWAGAPAEAVNVFVRALAKSPDDQALLAAVVDTAAAQGQLQVAVDALAARQDATALWYLGRARYLLADAERQAGKSDRAQTLLDDARKAFEGSMQKNGAYRESCEQWLAMCLGKKGNIAFFAKDLANAEAWLLESARMCPERIGVDLGLSETTKLGILRVADSHFRAGDLGKTEAIYRAASDLAKDDIDLLNNAGLFARDWGNQLERRGSKDAAMEMYEQSYKAYSRAQQLDPTNIRLRNDCALIAIYHLDRDWELSKRLLDAAIADGDKLLRDNPPTDRNDRQVLEEAVGDCYENLALWHLKHSKDAAAAKAAAEASRNYHPGARRPGARRHLQEAERLLQDK